MMELTWYVGSNRILNLTVRMFIYLHVCVGVCTHLRVYMCRMRAHVHVHISYSPKPLFHYRSDTYSGDTFEDGNGEYRYFAPLAFLIAY